MRYHLVVLALLSADGGVELGPSGLHDPTVTYPKKVSTSKAGLDITASQSVAEALIRRHRDEALDCYDLEKPHKFADVRLQLEIRADGSAKATPERDDGLSKCISLRASRWIFPRPAGGKPESVVATFSFSPPPPAKSPPGPRR